MKTAPVKILLFLLILSSSIYSQGEYLIKEYNIDDGLVQSTVNSSFIDNTGFLWFGTDKGLSRFDGSNFKNFSQPAELFSSPIMAISQNIDNKLLLLTEEGVLWSSDGILFKPATDLLPNVSVINSINLIDQTLFVSTEENGLFVMSEDTTFNFTESDGLFSNNILRVTTDRLNNINIITDGGVNQFRNNKITSLFRNEELQISNLIQHTKGNYWCTVDGQGIFRRENNKWVQHVFVHSVPFNALMEDSLTVIWSACDVLLHRIVDNSLGDVYSFTDIQMGVSSLTIDPSNNIWAGTFGNGVKKIKRNPFGNVLPMQEFPGFFALILCEDSNNNVWISPYQNGLVRFNDRLYYYTQADGLPDNLVLSACEYENEVLAATNKGIVVFKNEKFAKFTKPLSPIPGRPSRMFVDSRNTLWTATRTNGLYRLENNVWKEYKLDFPSGVHSVRVIFEDSKNNMWFGTYSDGLYLLKDGELIHFGVEDGLLNNTSVTLTEDQEGKVWFGTQKGIHIFENYKLVDVLTTEDGLITDIIYALATYKDKILIGTPDGLGIYSSGRFRFYTTADGLASNDISSHKMIVRDNGTIFFATNYGFTKFHIDKLLNKNSKYNFVLSDIISDEDTTTINYFLHTDPKEEVIFSSATDKIVFEFSPIDYSDLSFVYRYKFILNGNDGEWTSSNTPIFANYDCSPGKYNLVIQSKAFGGIWQNIDTLNFSIEYPFYRTSEFYSALILLILSGAVFIVLYKQKKQKEKAQNKYKTSALSEEKRLKLKNDLENVIIEKELYKNPELTLQALSKELGVAKEYVSQVINSEFQQNFNDYINRKRIHEATKLLQVNGKEGLQILQIAYEVGFNNKSSFNNAFKKFLNLTPSEYRKLHTVRKN